MTDAVATEIVHQLAPQGVLRAAINFGNPVLAQRDPTSGDPRGVSVDLARELACRLGLSLDFVFFESAGKVFEAVKTDTWDLAFLAIDPFRSAEIAFTAPYVVIEGTYLVRSRSQFQTIADVDRDGIRVGVGNGAAYDLYLGRTLQQAQIVRATTSQGAIELFISGEVDVAAGVRQPLEASAMRQPDLRVLDGRFMSIEQAMGIQQNRPAASHYLFGFVEEMKKTGFVADALRRSGRSDAAVAPQAQELKANVGHPNAA